MTKTVVLIEVQMSPTLNHPTRRSWRVSRIVGVWLVGTLGMLGCGAGEDGGNSSLSDSNSFGSPGGPNFGLGDGGTTTDTGGGGTTGTSDGQGGGRTGTLYCSTNDDCDQWRPICKGGKCVECTDDSHCTLPTGRCSQATNICLACLVDSDCGADEICKNGACESKSCTPGETACNGANLLTCRPDGVDWEPSQCDSGLCEDGACVVCEPACGENLVCWHGDCLTCKPFSKRCKGNLVEECSESGTWQEKLDCADQGIVCFEPGYCASACGGDPKFNNSNSGCDYWAIDLDNHYNAQDSPYAVIVSNLSDTPSTVTVTKQDGEASPLDTVIEISVNPGELKIIDLPGRHPNGAKVGWFGYRIRSTNQIIAYQFNPLDNVDVFSNDASLLLPVNTYGKAYRVFSMPELVGGGPDINPGENCSLVCGQYSGGQCEGSGLGYEFCSIPYRGTMTVVAPNEGTVVTIVPTAPTLGGNGLPPMSPGQTYTFELSPYQVLNIKTDIDGGDLTGTLVTADQPIGVFGGHEASVTSDRCCADHLEQQMFPVATWGSTYIATKAFPRGVENDYWRIMAAEDGTTISFAPAIQSTQTLDAGQWMQVVTDQDFVITADKPIGVAQILPSSQEAVSVPYGAPCTDTADCHVDYECTPIGEAGGWGEPCFNNLDCAPGYTCDIWLGACLSDACSSQGSTAQCSTEGQTCSCIDVVVNDNTGGCWCLPTVCVAPTCTDHGTNVGCPTGHTCVCPGEYCYCAPIGDPALIMHASAEQFRSDYVFLTPDKYIEDYVNIVAPAAATVTLDGTTVGAGYFTAIGSSGYKVARIKVGDGVHTVESTQPIGVVAYGFDRDVSYGYMAGLNLQKLTGD